MVTARINISFVHDWAEYLRGKLLADGIKLPASADDDSVCLNYYAYELRFPAARPRRIFKPAPFDVPAKVKRGLQLLEGKIANGSELWPHLSLGTKKISKQDAMLLDWGIYHFHLGTKPYLKNPSYIDRTGPLLYARLTEDEAYFIGVLNHGEWANDSLIRVLHQNWEDSIKGFRLKGVKELAVPIDSATRKQLRSGRVNTFIELAPGIIYAPLGGGFVSSGHPVLARMKTNAAVRWLRGAEKLVKAQCKSITPTPPAGFSFKLKVENGIFYAVDDDAGLKLKLRAPS